VSDDGKLLICLRPEEAEVRTHARTTRRHTIDRVASDMRDYVRPQNAKESGAWYDLTSSAFSNLRYGYIYHYYAAMTNLFASLCIVRSSLSQPMAMMPLQPSRFPRYFCSLLRTQGRNYNSMRLLLRDNLLLNSQHTAKVFRLLCTHHTHTHTHHTHTHTHITNAP
jgi:hypothetical protein